MSGQASVLSSEGFALGKFLRLALQLWLTLRGPAWFYTGLACRPHLYDPRAVPPTPVSRFADVCLKPLPTSPIATATAAEDNATADPATADAPIPAKAHLVPSFGSTPATTTSSDSDSSVKDGFLRVHYLHETSSLTTTAALNRRRPMLVQCFHGFGASSLSYRHVARLLAARLAALSSASDEKALVAGVEAGEDVTSPTQAPTASPEPEGGNAEGSAAIVAPSAQRTAVTVLAHDRCGFGLTSRPPLRLFGRRTESVQSRAANPECNPYSATVDATVRECARFHAFGIARWRSWQGVKQLGTEKHRERGEQGIV